MLENSLKKDIEREIPRIVEILKSEVPSLKEIRLCGSYIRGNWNPELSDIDIFVETGNEFYSVNRGIQRISQDTVGESKQRKEIRQGILDKTRNFKGNYSFLLMSSQDVNDLWNYEESNKGPFGKNLKKGRLLFNQT